MKLIDRVVYGQKALTELRGIRYALERIADHLQAAVDPDVAAQSAFRSRYDGKEPDKADLAYMDDEDRAELEERELDELRRGGAAVDGFYEGEDSRVAAVVGPTVAEQVERETAAGEEEGELQDGNDIDRPR